MVCFKIFWFNDSIYQNIPPTKLFLYFSPRYILGVNITSDKLITERSDCFLIFSYKRCSLEVYSSKSSSKTRITFLLFFLAYRHKYSLRGLLPLTLKKISHHLMSSRVMCLVNIGLTSMGICLNTFRKLLLSNHS